MNRKIKTVLSKGVSMLAASVLLIGMLQTGKVWADPSASLSKSGSAEVGKTVSINVNVSGDGPYGGYNGKVSYDSAYFELAGISSGNYGAANFSTSGASFLDYNCNIPSGSTIVVVKLKCLKEGTSKVSVSLNVSSQDGTADYGAGASAEISISAPVVLSGNNYLSSLSVAPGSLSPSFSKDKTSYHVTVAETQTSIAVSATAEHAKAKVSLNGVQKDLQMGDNTVKVTVTAENGEKRTYKINVTRGVPTPTPEPYPVIVTNGQSYTILEKESLETIPAGFTWSETTYNSKTVPCLVGPDGTMMMWLLSDSGNGLYIYDLTTQTVAPCYGYTADAVSMMIIPFPADFQVPAGYEKSTFTYNEHEIEVYKNTKGDDLPMLVYMLDNEGKSGLYLLDGTSGMALPFRGDVSELFATPTPVPTETPTPSPSPSPTPTDTPTPSPTPAASSGNGFKTATILLGIVSVALLALVVALLVMRQKENNAPVDPDDGEAEETKEDDESSDSVNSENEGDHYYQFGDEEEEPRRPGAKRAGEEEIVNAEPEKEEPLPDFPEFPEKKPEPAPEKKIMAAPLITVVDTSEKESDSKEEKKDQEPSDDDTPKIEEDTSGETQDEGEKNDEESSSDEPESEDEKDDGEI